MRTDELEALEQTTGGTPRTASLPDEATLQKFYEFLKRGVPMTGAAIVSGWNPPAMRRVMELAREGDEHCVPVLEAAEQAIALSEASDILTIDSAIRAGDVASAKWRLERRNPAEWGKPGERGTGGEGASGPIVLVFPGGAQPVSAAQRAEVGPTPIIDIEEAEVIEPVGPEASETPAESE